MFGSLLTAMVTVFHDDGSVDLEATGHLAEQLVDDGCDGLVVCGTTGEYSTMTDQENLSVFRAVKDAVGGRVPLLAGTGSNDTEHSRFLCLEAQKIGMDGLLIVTPYYNKPTQAGVEAHFRSLADSVDTPVMVYDIPGRSGIPIEPETMISLASHPNIVAVKDAKADFMAAARVMAETDLLFYSGDDERFDYLYRFVTAGRYDPANRTARVSVTANRAKTKNLARDPRATLQVMGDSPWVYAVADCDAELGPVTTRPDDQGAEDLVALYRAVQREHPDWDEFRQAMIDEERQVLTLHVTHLYGQSGG